MTNASKNTGAS